MNEKSIIRYFRRAKEVALLSDFYRFHIGCVAVYQGKIIGTGFNTNRSHPLQKQFNSYREFDLTSKRIDHKLHAEIHCLIQIKDMNIDFSKVHIFIYRKLKSRDHGLARPCPACMNMIKSMGIKSIYYTTDDGYIHENFFN